MKNKRQLPKFWSRHFGLRWRPLVLGIPPAQILAKPFRFWCWKKFFIYNCGLDEQYLLLDQPSKTSQKIFLLRKIGNCHICCLLVCCLHFPSRYGIHSNYLSCYYLWFYLVTLRQSLWKDRHKKRHIKSLLYSYLVN